MLCRHDRTFALHVLLGTVLTCGMFMGLDLHEVHANPPSNVLSQAKPIVFQSSMNMPFAAGTEYNYDETLFRNLVDIELSTDDPRPLSQTESIRLPKIQSSHHSHSRLARRIHVQQASESVLPMADLYFDFKRVRLGSDLIDVLHASVGFLPIAERRPIYLEVFCDQRGGMAYSLALAARRMDLVRKYFLDLGVPPHTVQAVNYGPLRPACQESTGRCQESNVRIQATFKFFAILESQFGCLTRIKVAYRSSLTESRNRAGHPGVHRQIHLAPLSRHR